MMARQSHMMRKRMIQMLIALGILFGLIILYKGFKSLMIAHYMKSKQNPTITVTAKNVTKQQWAQEITATASTRAVLGVYVTTELAGLISKVYFKPGSNVKKGQVLVELNIDADVAQLASLEAQYKLAQITYTRDKAQYSIQAVSKQQLDTDLQNMKNLQAQVAQQAATVDKKIIQAPFSGTVGISLVYPGQYLNVGDKVTTLQSLDPIYVDFYLPQQNLVSLRKNQKISFSLDTYPNVTFEGKITTINPIVETSTRNVEVEATVPNPKHLLLPGMFGNAVIDLGAKKEFLTVPQTAINYNSYGDIVFIIKTTGKDKKGNPIQTVTQSFVTVGDTRGDQIAILKGVNAGDLIVTSGQLKLKNGSPVAINNSVQPSDNPDPDVGDEG